MMKHYSYITQGTCSRQIDIDVDDNGCVQNVSFMGGCHGNLQGICALIRGMKAEDAKARLQGIRCGAKPTSCPDQLATALEEMGF